MVKIIKANGDIETFKKIKIENTVLKAGGSKKFAKEIANKVSKKVHKGTTTKEILKITLKLLRENPTVALKYNLKKAIMSLGPQGFNFEEYFSQILNEYGYKTKVGRMIKGKATWHEVDVLAENKKKFMIECKYHNKIGNHTNSRVAMYTYARYLDLHNNPKNKINQGWLVTNTKCTPHAIRYARGVGLKITSWQYASKGGKNLQRLIMIKKLYPITILHSVFGDVKDKLINAKILFAKELLEENISDLRKRTGLKEKQLKKLLKECNKICKKN
jgi:hypothetical protein